MNAAAGRVRSEAAQIVAAVRDGRSLKALLEPAQRRIADARDRAFLHAITMSTLRGAFRWQAMLARLLDTPIAARARLVEAALMTALAQIDDLGMPAHAVVDETVAAVRSLGFASHAGLANAVLRRWLREREVIAAAIADDPQARHNHPRWLLEQLQIDWPEDWTAIAAAANVPAPMWLRVNTRRIAVDDYLDRLMAQGFAGQGHPVLTQAVRLDEPIPVERLPGFAEGWVSVQDAAAQHAARLLAPKAGDRVLDACAAPGGKTAHLLEAVDDLGEVVALDRDAGRLDQVRQTLSRLGLKAHLRQADASAPATWWDGRPFDCILLDAPCSATGILRRQPDVRLHRRLGDIDALARQQSALLTALWPLLAPGGRLLYAVCSVLRAESEAVLAALVSVHDDADVLPIALPGARPLRFGTQILPGSDDMDGFAYVLLAKR
jgi:16S rRNA (cytosine967-C5)-methyltransferase